MSETWDELRERASSQGGLCAIRNRIVIEDEPGEPDVSGNAGDSSVA